MPQVKIIIFGDRNLEESEKKVADYLNRGFKIQGSGGGGAGGGSDNSTNFSGVTPMFNRPANTFSNIEFFIVMVKE